MRQMHFIFCKCISFSKWGALRDSLHNDQRKLDRGTIAGWDLVAHKEESEKVAVVVYDLVQYKFSLLSSSDERNMLCVHYLISIHSWAHHLEEMPHVSISHSSLYKHSTQGYSTLIGSTQSSHGGQFGTKKICALFTCKTGILHQVDTNNIH